MGGYTVSLACSQFLVCVGPGRKPRRPGFSQRGSYLVFKVHGISVDSEAASDARGPEIIMHTSPCNVHPLTPHFYIVKLGFTGVTLFSL